MHELAARVGPLSTWFHESLPDSGSPNSPSLDQVRSRVLAWRDYISDGLKGSGHLDHSLDWDEHGDTQWFPMSAADIHAMKLLLVYKDADTPAPTDLPGNPPADPVWSNAAGSEFENALYGELLAPGIWFPGRLSFNFRCPLPDGSELEAGFADALSQQCLAVTEKILGSTPFEWSLWESPPDADRQLIPRARAAVAALGQAAQSAEDRNVPIFVVPAPATPTD